MRKLILSVLITAVVMAISIAQVVAGGGIGPTP
jgi:hypothetical protein